MTAPDPTRDARAETLGVFETGRREVEPLTTAEVADVIGCQRRTAYDRLDRLVEEGHLATKKVGAKGRVWWRPPDGHPDDRDGPSSTARAQIHQQEAIRELGQLALDGDSIDVLVEETGRRLADALGADYGKVLEYDAAADRLHVRDGVGWDETAVEDATVPADESTQAGYTLRSAEPVVVEDWEAESRFERSALLARHGIRSSVGVLVGTESEPWGVLSAHATSPNAFADHDVAFASNLATLLATAIRRRDRDRELERYRRIVETMGDGVYTIDEDGRFTMVNGAYTDLFGYDRSELLGSHVSTVVDEDVVDRATAIESELLDDGQETADLEAEVTTAEGEAVTAEARFSMLETGDDYERIGVVRDVSERKERERALEARVSQQTAVTELGKRALENPDLDDLFDEAVDRVASTLDVDYCKVLDLRPDDEELVLRAGTGWRDGLVGSATVGTDRDSQAGYTLVSEEPVVVEDLAAETRFSGPELLITHDVTSGISVVIGSPDDPWGVLGTHDTDRRSFSEHDVNFVQSVANILATAIERWDRERRLIRQRTRLAALNDLNAVVRDITETLLKQSTREEVERTVCRRLAESDSYEFAWFGDVKRGQETVAVTAEAGVEGYLDDLTLSVDPDEASSRGPTGRALRTREVQVSRDIQTDPDYEQWRDRATEYGYRAAAAIPITHENALYGVLNVYADRAGAFADEEERVVGQLGDVVGHAIAAVERKRALMGEDVVEIEFAIRDVLAELDLPVDTGDPVVFDRVVPQSGDTYLVYGTATEASYPIVRAFVEGFPHWESAEVVAERADEVEFEARLDAPPAISVVAANGGRVVRAIISDGDYRMTMHLPSGSDVRRVVDAVQDEYPDIEVYTHRQSPRDPQSSTGVRDAFETDLTDRQRTALEAAYFGGFFEWPRERSGEDVADALDVSAATFHQHLRKAENKLFGALFADEDHVKES